MRQILTRPEPTVDMAYQYVKEKVAAPIFKALNTEQALMLNELLDTVHSCGCLYTASRVMHAYDQPNERRSPPQILLDIQSTNESIIAQVVPAEASSLSN